MKKSRRNDGPARSGGLAFSPEFAWHHSKSECEMEYLAGLIRRNAGGARDIALRLLAEGYSPAELVKAVKRILAGRR